MTSRSTVAFATRPLSPPPPQATMEQVTQDWLAFLIPLLVFVQFNIVGRLYVPEILLMVLLPFLLFFHQAALRSVQIRNILLFGLLWLCGQVITDIIRQSAFEDYVRGWSKIGVTLINLLALYPLLTQGGSKRFVLFAVGLACGQLITIIFHLNDAVDAYGQKLDDTQWKNGPGNAIALLVASSLTLSYKRKTHFLRTGVMMIFSGVSFVLGARNLGGACFITAIYLAYQEFSTHKMGSSHRTSFKTQMVVIFVFAISIISLSGLYSFTAANGYLGNDAQKKYFLQSKDQYGILLAGRSESLVATQAIIDSPFLGHGSWARDRHYIGLYVSMVHAAYGGKEDLNVPALYKSRLIPTHSHLLGAWVESGILGALFWLYILMLTCKVLLRYINMADSLSPLIIFSAITFIWDIFFSPFGSERRLTVAYTLVVLIYAYDRTNRFEVKAKLSKFLKEKRFGL